MSQSSGWEYGEEDSGLSQNQMQKFQEGEVINDFIIPPLDPEISSRHRGRHFQIEYSLEENCYKIKDLGVGFGVFYKLEFQLLLKQNQLINFGGIFMVVNYVSPNQHLDDESLDIDFSHFSQS